MTIALSTYAPGRHRLDEVVGYYWRLLPPQDHTPTSHRRSRTGLMQLTVADLTGSHSRRAARPRWWKRVAVALAEYAIRVFEPEPQR